MRTAGFEPASPAWKADNHPSVGPLPDEELKDGICCSRPLSYVREKKHCEQEAGFEPTWPGYEPITIDLRPVTGQGAKDGNIYGALPIELHLLGNKISAGLKDSNLL